MNITNTIANEMTIEQISALSPVNAANFLRAIAGSDASDLWTPEHAKQVLKHGWANGNSAGSNEIAALTVIASADDLNY